MVGPDVVGCLCLLNRQSKIRSQIIPHQPKSRMGRRIVKLTTVEVCHVTRAAIEAYCPEVVIVLFSGGNGCHTVGVQVPEPHGVGNIQFGIRNKMNTTGIHQLVSFTLCWIDHVVLVHVVHIHKRDQVRPVVHVTENHRECKVRSAADEEKEVPSGLSVLSTPEILQGRVGQQEDYDSCQPNSSGNQARAGVVEAEATQAIDDCED
mmetsp:Transcript_97503/g.135530  ORF Transcript_97503/g.135530 Transcript_97503/m.135530 type:complete len:206 (-) Transcript_97503:87-704(-)